MELDDACTFSQRVATILNLDGWTVKWEELANKDRPYADNNGIRQFYMSPGQLYDEKKAFRDFVTWYLKYRYEKSKDEGFKLGAKKAISEIRNYRRNFSGWFDWYERESGSAKPMFLDPNHPNPSVANISTVDGDKPSLDMSFEAPEGYV
jgi:hypothetical protein